MSIENIEKAMKKHLEQTKLEKKEKKEAREAYKRGVRLTDNKIKQFIKLLRQDQKFRDSEVDGIFINLGRVDDFTDLHNCVADFLGKSEKRDKDEQVRVQAYKGKDSLNRLRVSVGTSSGTDRHIEITTRVAWNDATMSVDFWSTSSAREPESIKSAMVRGRDLTQGADWLKEELKIGEKLVDFALRETVRVITPLEERH